MMWVTGCGSPLYKYEWSKEVKLSNTILLLFALCLFFLEAVGKGEYIIIYILT